METNTQDPTNATLFKGETKAKTGSTSFRFV